MHRVQGQQQTRLAAPPSPFTPSLIQHHPNPILIHRIILYVATNCDCFSGAEKQKKHIVESFEWINAALQEKLVYTNISLFCLDMLQETQTNFV
jgi:hypothetical protein